MRFYRPEAFDTYLEVIVSHNRFYPNLANNYMGTSLHIFDLHKNAYAKIIATLGFVEPFNFYRQYFVERNGISFVLQNG